MRLFYLTAILLTLLCACAEKPLEAQRRSRDEKIVQAIWTSASKVSSPEEIIGTWISEKGDLPKGFDVISYDMTFGAGGGSFSQVSKDGATGLPFEYEIRQSKLYASTAGPPLEEWAEIRKFKMLMLKKTKNIIFVFRKVKGN
jgi:hypothetical protein